MKARHSLKTRLSFALLLCFLVAGPLLAQNDASAPHGNQAARRPDVDAADRDEKLQVQPGEDPQNRLLTPFLKHLAGDQKEFWTTPFHLQPHDLKWAVPFAGITAGFIASDQWWSKQVPNSPSQLNRSKNISDYTTFGMIGLGGGAFLLGEITNNDHVKESGLLSAEAAINSTGVTYLFKEISQRQRPMEGNHNGDFFTGGQSFTSEHSAIAWSIASVLAHEYPSTLSQLALYSAATAVSVTRVTAQQHFPADVFVGSALGWYFGRQVYRAHHDPEVGGTGWGGSWFHENPSQERNPAYMASPYVPVDSWIYPALERLIALGLADSNMMGIRPWTRMACAQLIVDSQDKITDALMDSETNAQQVNVDKLYSELHAEFTPEIARLGGEANLGASVDSIYTRVTGISGTPLRDSFNFGQTVVNDYGRPYWTGLNNVTGLTAQAELGPVALNLDAEYQHAPAIPSYSPSTLADVAAADFHPVFANGISSTDRVRLLNSTVSLNINNVQFTFGEQSSWLGPSESGSFLMGNNAEPIPMLRIDDVARHDIPGLSKILGPFRTEFFIGQLSGHHWEACIVSTCQSNPSYPGVVGPAISPQPFIHGEKISFQPTPNLEIGMGITAMFGGPGLPVTFGNFFRTYYVHSSTAADNPGKRISQADFSYRIPGLRNWLTLYMDSLVVDEASPIGSTRANVNPGIFMPQFPCIPKLQLRAEGFNESRHNAFFPGFVYFDARRYLDGYTNAGLLMGSPFGRASRGGQGWLTYWLSGRDKLEFSYRLQTVSPQFIGGGRLNDFSAKTEFVVKDGLSASAFLQYERWLFPDLNPLAQTNFTTAVQLTCAPHLGRK